ncbi:flavodoxin family protein [Salinispira pacifica]
MKVLSLIGSGRQRGNTARIVEMVGDAFAAACEKRGDALEWRTLFLGDVCLGPCRGCRSCFNHGEDHCPNGDRLLEVRDAILSADAVVLASPVYVNDVSGMMKTLIDRLAFVCHRPQFMRTPFLLLATTGDTPARHALRTMQSAAVSWGAPLLGAAGFVTGARSDSRQLEAHRPRADRIAHRTFRRIVEKRHERPSFIALMVFAIQQRAWRRLCESGEGGRLDCAHWRDSGWFDPRVTYFFPHRSAPLLTATARAVAAVVGRIVAG